MATKSNFFPLIPLTVSFALALITELPALSLASKSKDVFSIFTVMAKDDNDSNREIVRASILFMVKECLEQSYNYFYQSENNFTEKIELGRVLLKTVYGTFNF